MLIFQWFYYCFLKSTFLHRCAFSIFLSALKWNKLVHWWSPGAQNNANTNEDIGNKNVFGFSEDKSLMQRWEKH